jgi:hypothetical protein
MPNLVRIDPTVWISIPDSHTNPPGFNFIYKIYNSFKNKIKVEKETFVLKRKTNEEKFASATDTNREKQKVVKGRGK